MQQLNLKPTHAPVKAYYQALGQYGQLNIDHEMAVRSAFQHLLEKCGSQFNWTLIAEYPLPRPKATALKVDGALLDEFRLKRGLWEAKDEHDDLEKEAKRKIAAGCTGAQCFPFYTYDEDGANPRDNITDWGLEHFRAHYKDQSITKWDVFHYLYAVLHHPIYRERYSANLQRDFPRIPFTPEFRPFAKAGKRLADLHVNYEEQAEFKLEMVEKLGEKLNLQVKTARLNKDKTAIIYNDFLTLKGIQPETFEYRLGNRSALEWVIDQYQVFADKRSGITNDPNRPDDPNYILRLIRQVITVSLETNKIVRSLPELGV